MLRNCDVVSRGTGNNCSMTGEGTIVNSRFYFYGNNNTVIIDDDCVIRDATFWIEDDGNCIHIKKGTKLTGTIQLACIEGTSIEIGENCLFSSEITIRTGDSHSVLNMNGERINPSKDIVLGNHCWIGHRAMIQKGVTLSNNTIVGSNAVVTKSFAERNIAIAGNPAKAIKTNVNWDINRI